MILRTFWHKEESKYMNFSMILYVLAWVLKLEAFSLILPLICAVIYHEWASSAAILLTAVGADVIGLLLGQKKPKRTDYYAREGFITVALCWIIMSLVGALPFFLTGAIPSYIDAVFEIVSGFTTTGSSILTEVEHLGKGLLFWRSFSHWIGGMGVLVLVLTILPLGGGYNLMIMKAESPGPDVSKMVPRVADTAKALYKIYLILTIFMILIFVLSGMPVFDALCIGFGTAGTGGFAVRNSGMADYSMLSQFLITVFMIMFGVNFNVYYMMQQKRIKDALHCEEARIYLIIIAISTFFIGCNILPQVGDLHQAFHHAFFTVGSIITTTGFGTLDFALWPQASQMILLFLMLCGACAGSTGGGLKVSRVIIMMKEIRKELTVIIHPEAVMHIRLEKKSIEHSVVRSVNCYLIMYVLIFLISVFLISWADNFDFTTNFSAVAATFNNIGPGLGMVGPTSNFSTYSDFSKLVLIFDMLAGRLEILPMMILFTPRVWRKSTW